MSSDQTPPEDPESAPDDGTTREHRQATPAASEDETVDRATTRPAASEDETREHRQAADPAPHGAGTSADPPPGLYRSSGDRMLFGVAGGIGERYGIEPLLVRLGFVATVFVGGAGILFYLAAALLIPSAPAGVGPDRRGGPAVGAANGALRLLVTLGAAIGVLAALGVVAGFSLGATAFFGAWPVAVLLLVVAVLLVVSSTRSRAATGSLLVLALALAVPATAATLSDLRVDRTFGDRIARPATVERAADGYRLGFGHLTVDLRRTPFRQGTTTRVPVRLDAGRLGVLLSRKRCVAYTIRTRLTAGDVQVLDDETGADPFGTADRTIRIDPPRRDGDRRPRVMLDLRSRAGQILVGYTQAAISEVPRYGFGGRDGDGVREVDDDTLRTPACRAADREQSRR